MTHVNGSSDQKPLKLLTISHRQDPATATMENTLATQSYAVDRLATIINSSVKLQQYVTQNQSINHKSVTTKRIVTSSSLHMYIKPGKTVV